MPPSGAHPPVCERFSYALWRRFCGADLIPTSTWLIPQQQCFRSRAFCLPDSVDLLRFCWFGLFFLIFVLLPWVSRLCSKTVSFDVIYNRECAQGVIFWKWTGCSRLILYPTSIKNRLVTYFQKSRTESFWEASKTLNQLVLMQSCLVESKRKEH